MRATTNDRLPSVRPRCGFTLVEILAVMAILAILAGLVAAALVASKRSAHAATTVSNLHQTWIALSLYADDNGGWPTENNALTAVASAPICDATDTWRKSCNEKLGNPMLGSYAYVYNVPSFLAEPDSLSQFMTSHENPAMLISLFPMERPIVRFSGEHPDASQCKPASVCAMPPYVTAAFKDGSTRRVVVGPAQLPTSGFPLVIWYRIFDRASTP